MIISNANRYKISKVGLKVECPGAGKEVAATNCTRTKDDKCEFFQDILFMEDAAWVVCEYGVESKSSSILVPEKSESAEGKDHRW